MKTIWQRSEFAGGRFDGALRLEIERIRTRTGDESDSNNGAIATNHESNLCTPGRIGIGRIEAKGNLANDVVQIPWEWEIDSLGLDGRDIRALAADWTAPGARRRQLRRWRGDFLDRRRARSCLLRSCLRDGTAGSLSPPLAALERAA